MTAPAVAPTGYAASLRSADAPYVGSFLCPSPRLGELLTVLAEELPDDLPQLDLSLVAPGGIQALNVALEQVAQSGRLVLRAVELPAGDAGVILTATRSGRRCRRACSATSRCRWTGRSRPLSRRSPPAGTG